MRIQLLLATEGQELNEESSRLVGGVLNLLKFPPLRRGELLLPHEQLGLAEDDGEDIFEIVSGARSQAANGFHFLRLPQLFLRLLQCQLDRKSVV